MDIAGAKALKERLGAKAAERAASPRVDVHEDAHPCTNGWESASRTRRLTATTHPPIARCRSSSGSGSVSTPASSCLPIREQGSDPG